MLEFGGDTSSVSVLFELDDFAQKRETYADCVAVARTQPYEPCAALKI